MTQIVTGNAVSGFGAEAGSGSNVPYEYAVPAYKNSGVIKHAGEGMNMAQIAAVNVANGATQNFVGGIANIRYRLFGAIIAAVNPGLYYLKLGAEIQARVKLLANQSVVIILPFNGNIHVADNEAISLENQSGAASVVDATAWYHTLPV